MNRNVESHFAYNPTNIDIQRSTFDRSATMSGSANVGELVPFYLEEVLPGDTFKVTSSKVIRLQTMLKPIMSNIYADFYYFYVKDRLVWDHWKQFMGENTESAWLPENEYSVPQMMPSGHDTDNDDNPDEFGWQQYSLADYFGLPIGYNNNTKLSNGTVFTKRSDAAVSALPFRMYHLIWNEFFRSEAIQDPVLINTGDSNEYLISMAASVGNETSDRYSPLRKADRYFDLFSSCLPSPQRSPDVLIPISNTYDSVTKAVTTYAGDFFNVPAGQYNKFYPLHGTSNFDDQDDPLDNFIVTVDGNDRLVLGSDVSDPEDAHMGFVPTNLGVKFTGYDMQSFMTTINNLRLAFQIQKLYEKDARGGTRYIEVIKSHFGVTSPDGRINRPEYLGGNRVPINVHEVTNSSESASYKLGTLGAKSHTSDVHEDFVHSFTEHGYILGLMVLRTDRSYSQMTEKHWNRKNRLDYYFPVLANIGEQPVLNKEICTTGDPTYDNGVFGYNEAFYEYRYKPSACVAEMRPSAANSLASWHLADAYDVTDPPYLSPEWLEEGVENVDRTIAVTSSVSNQYWYDIYVRNIATRAMPMYSIPGLIDHH